MWTFRLGFTSIFVVLKGLCFCWQENFPNTNIDKVSLSSKIHIRMTREQYFSWLQKNLLRVSKNFSLNYEYFDYKRNFLWKFKLSIIYKLKRWGLSIKYSLKTCLRSSSLNTKCKHGFLIRTVSLFMSKHFLIYFLLTLLIPW